MLYRVVCPFLRAIRTRESFGTVGVLQHPPVARQIGGDRQATNISVADFTRTAAHTLIASGWLSILKLLLVATVKGT